MSNMRALSQGTKNEIIKPIAWGTNILVILMVIRLSIKILKLCLIFPVFQMSFLPVIKNIMMNNSTFGVTLK